MNTVANESVEIPGYRVERAIGVGGMASVYLALQESLDREVALKVMSSALADNEEFADRFLKEGRLTAKLSHPNLVTVYDIGKYGQVYYLAQEYIPGGTLRERMNAGMTVPEILDVVRDIAQGLAYAHEKGVVHRDVKPGNVLFRANGTAVLADFGIAKAMDSTTMSTQAGNSIGTPHYMSPEQARAEKVDGRSDIYSLGAMLFEMLAGTPPYEASDPFSIALMHVTHPVPTLPPPHAWLQPLIDNVMAKLPERRFATGDELIAGCDKLVATAPEAQALRDAQITRKRARVSSFTAQPTEIMSADSMKTPRRVPSAQSANAGSAGGAAGSRTKLAAILAGVAVLVFGIVWGVVKLLPKPQTSVAADPIAATQDPLPSDPVTQPETTTGIVDLGGDPTLDPSIEPLPQGDINTLLARAKTYVDTGIVDMGRRFISPPGDNAVALFNAVLAQDPGNIEARNGLDRIAEYYESRAKGLRDRNVISGCKVLAEQGLKANPERASLRALFETGCDRGY